MAHDIETQIFESLILLDWFLLKNKNCTCKKWHWKKVKEFYITFNKSSCKQSNE